MEFLLITKIFKGRILNYQKKDIIKELKIADISKNDKVLFIGTGLLPTTPIVIIENIDTDKVISIDNNTLVNILTKAYINKIGISDKIVIEYGDGANYPIKDFDVIIMAGNIWPLKKILKHMSTNMKKDAKLICRGTKNDIFNIFEQESLYDSFSVEALSEHVRYPDYKSILFKKK